jgi:hypothetical protein
MMKLMSLMLALVLAAGSVAYGGQGFNNGSGDETWGNPANWTEGVVPNDATTHPGSFVPVWGNDNDIRSNATMTIGAGEDWETYSMRIAQFGSDNAVMNMSGGDVFIGPWGLNVGRGRSSQHGSTDGTLNMSGGLLDAQDYDVPHAWAPDPLYDGSNGYIAGTVNHSGGHINVRSQFSIGREDGIGLVHMSGDALVTTVRFHMNRLENNQDQGAPATGSLIIDDAARVVIDGIGGYVPQDPGDPTPEQFLQDKMDLFNNYIAAGWISSNGGAPVVLYNQASDKITIAPEPVTMSLLGLGGLLIRRRKAKS